MKETSETLSLFSRSYIRLSDWIPGNPGHEKPGFLQIFHFGCCNSCVIARFTMAVDFSCLKKIKNRFVFRMLGCTS